MNLDVRIIDRLDHIREAADAIDTDIAGIDEQTFIHHDILVHAIVWRIGVIGEASAAILKLDPRILERFPGVELNEARAMRNRLIHGYAAINPTRVWLTVNRDIPRLRSQVVEMCAALKASL